MKLNYINLSTTDPEFNLAAEEYVFDYLPKDRMYLMLWQNDNAVIIGKYQNTLAEINEKYVNENNVKVVRRLSGGGAVYHDMGNLNFTIITDADRSDELNFNIFCEPVVQTLAKIGVHAEINGRNDITVDGRKISGNSQYIKMERVMHHGTILLNSDLDAVGRVLVPDAEKLQSKGKQSVRSRVANVSEFVPESIDIESFKTLLVNTVSEQNDVELYSLSQKDIEKINEIRENRYSKWDWNYGKSQECSFVKSGRVDGVGKIEAHITCEHSVITDISFHGDFFSSKDPDELSVLFIGCRTDEDAYRHVLEQVNCGDYFNGIDEQTLLKILI